RRRSPAVRLKRPPSPGAAGGARGARAGRWSVTPPRRPPLRGGDARASPIRVPAMTISHARFEALSAATAWARAPAGNGGASPRIDSYFGCDVFSQRVMRQRLPKDVYKRLMRTIEQKQPLDVELAHVVATALKEWAIENGATHYTHWFQPLTGSTAEKHDSFI